MLAGAVLLLPFGLMGTSDDQFAKEQMISDLETLKNSFRIQYAPKDWKKRHFDWELDLAIARAREEVESLPGISVKNYQYIVKNFFKSLHDYHTSVYFYSTESAILPFTVKGFQGRFFIASVEDQRLDYSTFWIGPGDEILEFGGRPILDAVEELQNAEFGTVEEGTDRSLTEMLLTARMGMMGSQVPSGPLAIKTRSDRDGLLRSYEIAWDYRPEKVTNGGALQKKPAGLPSLRETLMGKKMLAPIYNALAAVKKQSSLNMFELGFKRSYVPCLGKEIWSNRSDSHFHAYIYLDEEGRSIGYVRIPSYEGDQDDVNDFSNIIDFFEENTEALVIDQLNNPGGSVFYLYTLASMFADEPLNVPLHRYLISQSDVFEALEYIPELESVGSDSEARYLLGDTLDGYPVNHQLAQFALSYYRFILEQWNAGKPFTDPFWLLGVSRLNPSPYAQYTKPILLLVNELDFSGADFFPAIMQDNNRVTILGVKTAGAGGVVSQSSYPNRFGIAQYTYTATIAERLGGQPIENLGVVPDIEYVLTVDDYLDGFLGYSEAINKAVSDIQ